MDDFARRLLRWHRSHGRTGLPWQRSNDPYGVWLSEIMLQQTQVGTVIPYYERFVARFPDLASLAAADIDAVLHLWSGLGYYARARNLHRAAQRIMAEFDGRFPDDLDDVMSLPGIGRSTAGAILAFSFDQRHAILDGNVKRVLTRAFAIEGYPGDSAVSRRLWALAERLTPAREVARYTQAIMDLGATVCVRGRPDCGNCPLHDGCEGRIRGIATSLPTRKRKKPRPLRSVDLLLLEDAEGRILLERRPPSGIWGGLWSLPELARDDTEPDCPLPGVAMAALEGPAPQPVRHGFTHFELEIHPRRFRLMTGVPGIMDADGHLWYNRSDPEIIGLPAVIERLLSSIN